MKTIFGTIFVTSCFHFLRLAVFFFQDQSMAGDVIQQIKIKSLNMNKCKVLNRDLGWGGLTELSKSR